MGQYSLADAQPVLPEATKPGAGAYRLSDATPAATEGDYPLFSKIPGFNAVKPVFDAAAGAGGTFAQHAVNAYDLIRKIPGAANILPDSSELHKAIADATPENTPAHVGRFLEGVSEFMYPAGKAEELTQGAGLVARTAAQAGVAGGVSAVQSGGDPKATATGALLGAAGPLVGASLDAAAPSVVPAIKRVAAQVLGRTTGAGPAAIAQAIDHPTPELLDAMRGNTSEGQVLTNFKDALQNVKDARSADYQAALANIPRNITLDPSPVWDKFEDMLGKFSIARTAPVTTEKAIASPVVDALGRPIMSTVENTVPSQLDFSRSTVTDRAAQKQIQSVYSDLMDWGSQKGDATPQGMDVLKRRIGNMYSDDSQASALIASVRDSAASVLKQNVPGYADMTKGYETASKFIEGLGDLSIDSRNPGIPLRKLTTALRQNNDYRQMLTDALGQFSGVDLKGQLAGLNLSKAGPQGMAGVLDTGIGILGLLAHGYLSPSAAVSMAAASPRLMGELVVAMGKAGPALKAAGSAIGAIAPASANAALNAPRP
jgi:hypothetical protein